MSAVIRVATGADAGDIAAIYAPVVRESAASFETVPPSEAEMAARIDQTEERCPWLVYSRDGAVAGYAYASPYRVRVAYQWSVEVTVYVGSDARRQGVGRRLYGALFAVLAHQGFRNVYAGITLPNKSSVALHRAVGFRPVGVYEQVGWKMDRWHDVGWWQRSIGEHGAAPDPPRWLSAVDPEEVARVLGDATGHG